MIDTNEYDEWNKIKQNIQNTNIIRSFKERDIFYLKMGKNVGYEQNGKGEEFIRPIIIIKKFNQYMFIGIPLSSQIKEGLFYYKFDFIKNDKLMTNVAILSQVRVFSTNRLLNKIGVIDKDKFTELKTKLKDILV